MGIINSDFISLEMYARVKIILEMARAWRDSKMALFRLTALASLRQRPITNQ